MCCQRTSRRFKQFINLIWASNFNVPNFQRANYFFVMKIRFLLLVLALSALTGGCYKRTVVPGYSSNAAEVKKIRQQLGARTIEKEYINDEEE
jgi:hypothetical protein